ncbi:hypothetical protein F8388_000056 [Cannabis sativa]|uniref:Reverse transcriptase zinc-binding domain-containing protein n=1 Tax=Cannabis sativa TaxID=3483 RepID=A0A7J6EP09_CANSA|nr:hypothetical protein F8388_000056 [Cannabis sativa]KAF4386060.1 hypothetical protein G4B88_031195 [Cannabis sativa]
MSVPFTSLGLIGEHFEEVDLSRLTLHRLLQWLSEHLLEQVDFNLALLSKLAWMLATGNERPWIRSLKAKYFALESFWQVSPKASDSPGWKGILEARRIIMESATTIIHNGEDIDIWFQPWIPWLNYTEFRDTMEGIRSKAPALRSESRSVRSRLIIKAVRIWLFGRDQTLHSGIHPRQSMILWRAILDALPTRNRYGGDNGTGCFFCNDCEESPLHLFGRCTLARAIWFGGPVPIHSEQIVGSDLAEFASGIISILKASNMDGPLIWLASVMEIIWLWRNKLNRGLDVTINPEVILAEIKSRYAEMVESLSKTKNDHKADSMKNPTEASKIPFTPKVIVVDGAFKNGKSGGAFVAIDYGSNTWEGNYFRGTQSDATGAEMEAINMALGWAEDRN